MATRTVPTLGDADSHHRYVKRRDMDFAESLIANATSLGISPANFRQLELESLPALVERCDLMFPEFPFLLWWPHSQARADRKSANSFASRQLMDELGYQRIPVLVPDSTEWFFMFAENWGKVKRRGFDALMAFDTTLTQAHDVIGESHL